MRDLAIAYGNNRQAKKWVNKTTKYEDLKERLKVTIRTTESAEEYAKMSKAQRDAAKDHGGFVGGVLAGGRRKVDTVESRSMIALDGDRIDTDFLDNYETNAPYTSFLYTTHSHTPENPRVRLIFPMTRDITAEEFVAVSRYLAQMLGIDFFDECSYQPNQLIHDRKLDALEDLIEGANGKPVLIAYWYQHDADRIKARFDVREIKTSKDIEDWNAGMIPAAIIHPASAGHGLNLQTGGSTLIWFGLTWSLELYQQTNARLHRQGQKETVVIHHIIAKGTIDEQVMKALRKKEKTQDALIDAVKANLKASP